MFQIGNQSPIKKFFFEICNFFDFFEKFCRTVSENDSSPTLYSRTVPSPSPPFPRVLAKTEYAHLGELLRMDHLSGSSQMLCRYRNTSTASTPASPPISLICELGCCPNVRGGCCSLDEASAEKWDLANKGIFFVIRYFFVSVSLGCICK